MIDLQIGLDTFRPIAARTLEDHSMHSETYRVPEETALAIAGARRRGGRIVAVGTTVVRTLESAVDESGAVEVGSGTTSLFIVPGHEFRAVDAVLTNFHAPRTTLVVLIAALIGPGWRDVYRLALDRGYRFLFFRRRDVHRESRESMTGPVWWERDGADGAARSGVLHTPHGDVPTPAFMPVGTRGSVKTLDSGDLEAISTEIVLANTYHLMLRPGAETVASLGDLHGFMAWPRPILTDSGGYQVFSLSPDVDDEGVVFKSSYDGSRIELTPERAVGIQESLGADIAMALDVLIGLPAPRADVSAAMERTLRWADRTLAARQRGDQGVFGIVQGGTDPDLRARSAAETAARPFDGFGIGGLSVGEHRHDRNAALEAVMAELPRGKVRYVMGLGDTEGLLDAIGRGADLFDCVLPTRLARHGKVLHPDGDYSIKRREWSADDAPLETDCKCPACRRYSRGYLRHLFSTREPLGPRLVTLHNVWYTLRLMENARGRHRVGRVRCVRRRHHLTKGALIVLRQFHRLPDRH